MEVNLEVLFKNLFTALIEILIEYDCGKKRLAVICLLPCNFYDIGVAVEYRESCPGAHLVEVEPNMIACDEVSASILFSCMGG